MDKQDFEARVERIKREVHGRWTAILRALGVDEKILNGKNQPCPLCGGTDRFQYTDRFGSGNYHCRGCGPGGGLKLAQACLGISFAELLRKLEGQIGVAQAIHMVPASGPTSDRMRALCRKIWQQATPVASGDPVDCYLRNRGIHLTAYPKALRCHMSLGYYEKVGNRSTKVAEYPAMLACVQGSDGHGIALHRTYLDGGRKVATDAPKKLLSSGINGAGIRLQEATTELSLTEGIETGLAVLVGTHAPVWAAINCGNLEKLWIPDSVECVRIYADNDADGSYDGQAAAYVLARRLKKERRPNGTRRVEVYVPRRAGTDYADVWLHRWSQASLAAA